MTRYYTAAEMAAAVRHQAAIDHAYYTGYQDALRTNDRSWLYELVSAAVQFTFGPPVGQFVMLGVDAVWDYFADLFE
ncbi:hypothetical protein [Lentzea californiensis]|uniref:hypothetical protein n=1 Tax=Lentzea californiensis TaxID=438851 RepID=UPI0021660327|nr:hypothetical protein [Lentzea californiensis]MCR3754301.1 hypothetical protein [Lentzea californiensis]